MSTNFNQLSAKQRLDLALQEMGLQAKKSLGQNFLISDGVIGKILAQVKALDFDQLIEIGPGPGALTDLLLLLGKPYLSIELDDLVYEYWKGKGVEIHHADALQISWKDFFRGHKNLLVSNLPYQISSSLVIERSLESTGLEYMVLMFQKEVAQRIRATESTEHYGLLSVVAQSFWEISTVSEAGPGDFSPAPKVASRVLLFRRKQVEKPVNREEFLSFVKQAFQQRRKLMRKNLQSYLQKVKRSESDLESWLVANQHSPMARAEELSVQDFLDLHEALQ